MLNAGFQYLEQRDANDAITKDGVVGKNSPFSTSDNSGIYDIIAENLRWLKENVDDVKDTSDLEAIKQSVTDMYNDMKNNSSFGATAAKAQAEEAKKQAQAALESATNARTYHDEVMVKSTEINDTLAEIKNCIDKAQALIESNKELEQTLGSYVTVASNKAKVASDSATNASASAENAATSATSAADSAAKAEASIEKLGTHEANAATSASNAATSAEHAKTSETNAKASETDAKTSATNAKTSETNSKTSETNARTSETNASNSADLAKKWAESSESPDTMDDTDSPTGKTQSSKSWALYAKDRAISAYSSESNAKASETASKTSETNTKASETNAAKSASNAKASEIASKTSETNAAASAFSAKTSEDNASTSKSNAKNSETNAKSYMDTAKEYMQKAQEALAAAQAIQSIVDTAKANAEKCVADVEAVRDSLAKMMTYQGSVDNYSDLPENPQVGYSYNVKNADKEHGVNAGDNVVWNGESWDNLGGSVDMSLFAELGKDVRFNAVTATTFTGNLKGTADNATTADTATRATAADNANRLGGYPLNSNSIGSNWGTVPRIGTDGGMEVGKYIDWHPVNGGSADYTSRWEANSDGTVTVGTINGTLNGNAATATKATTADKVNNLGAKTAIKDGAQEPNGLSLYQCYENGYPTAYGNLLSIGGIGGGELLAGWSDTDKGIEHLYYRNRRNTGALWSDWITIVDSENYNKFSPTPQKVNVSFNSDYVGDVTVYKVGHLVWGYFSIKKSTTSQKFPVISNLPKAIAGWGAVVYPINTLAHKGAAIRVHMEQNETTINLHYSNEWQESQGNEAELSFTYVTND